MHCKIVVLKIGLLAQLHIYIFSVYIPLLFYFLRLIILSKTGLPQILMIKVTSCFWLSSYFAHLIRVSIVEKVILLFVHFPAQRAQKSTKSLKWLLMIFEAQKSLRHLMKFKVQHCPNTLDGMKKSQSISGKYKRLLIKSTWPSKWT